MRMSQKISIHTMSHLLPWSAGGTARPTVHRPPRGDVPRGFCANRTRDLLLRVDLETALTSRKSPQFRPCSARTFEHRPGSTRSDDQFPSAANDVGREISMLSPYRFVFGIAGVARLELGAALLPTGETMTPARDGSSDPARREKRRTPRHSLGTFGGSLLPGHVTPTTRGVRTVSRRKRIAPSTPLSHQ